ncbi:Elongation factor [Venturia nashicola]|nr:Elongation factor [Venturia nashicola]
MSNAPAACCVSGVKHEGEPVGLIKEIGGIKSYVATPEKDTKNAILYIPDAFGLELINNKLLADDLARAGYLVVIPDVFRGNPVPESVLTEGMGSFDIMGWVKTHPTDIVDPILDAVIKDLKASHGITRIGAVGYCFGGKYVVRYLAAGKGVDAGFVAHPSFLTPEEVEAAKGPLSIAAPEVDQIFPAELKRKVEDILEKKKLPYQVTLYGGVEHGFAVRTDLKIKEKKFAKESAYFQAVRWFDEYVKED